MKNAIALSCLILFVAVFSRATAWASSADTLWVERWERTDWTNDWHVDAGTWEVGVPTSGPGKSYQGQKCAATVLTGNYGEPVDSRLIRHTSFIVPPASQNPRLRLWHWYSFAAGDYGRVQISTNGGTTWNDLSETYLARSSSVWTYPSLDLSAYAGQSVQIAFYFHSHCVDCFRGDVSSGWYVDAITVISGAYLFNITEGWESGIGDWYVDRGTWEVGDPTGSAHNGQNCAGTVLTGNYGEPVDSRLISPAFIVPSADQNPRLRFYHWFLFAAGDYGEVQIRMGNGAWQKLSETYSSTGSNVWTYPSLDLRAYGGLSVQIAFYFHSQCGDCFRGDVNLGWYIDDLEIVTGPIIFNTREGWESGIGDWYVDKGTWEVGDPTGSAHNGQNCAGTVLTGNYGEPVDSRLISPAFVVPSADQNPRLRFYHWFLFAAGDYGEVQIRTGNGVWQKLSEPYSSTGSNVWTYPSLDLRAYGGLSVQIAFYFHSQCVDCFRGDVNLGWYIDDLEIVTGPIVFNNPEGWEFGIGDWYVDKGTWEVGIPNGGACVGQKGASTVLLGNYSEPVTSRLVSPQFVVPSRTKNPSLGFWHRYIFAAGDSGFVQIRVGKGKWVTILGPYTGTSSGACSPPFKDLSVYADSTVQIAFYFKSQCIDCFRGDVQNGWDVDEIRINGLVSVEERSSELESIESFALHQNYPNPFNPSTVILYDLPRASQVEVAIFNLLGEKVRTLVNQRQQPGQYSTRWDGHDENGKPVPSGVYLYRLQAGGFLQTRKMILMQ